MCCFYGLFIFLKAAFPSILTARAAAVGGISGVPRLAAVLVQDDQGAYHARDPASARQ